MFLDYFELCHFLPGLIIILFYNNFTFEYKEDGSNWISGKQFKFKH